MRINAPLARVGAHEAHRALTVFARVFLDRVNRVGLATEPILQNERGHTNAVEILRRLHPFRVEDQFPVTAAGTNHHRGTRGLFFRWQKHRERWIVNVADPVLLRNFRFVAALLKARRAVRPEEDFFRLLSGYESGRR